MKLVCHIGTPKTASTFLQNSCAANADWLKSRGVVYPDMLVRGPNHITLFYAGANKIHDFARDYGLQTEDDVARFREELSQHIAAQVAEAKDDCHTMLMSSENICGNLSSPEEIARLRDLLAPHFDEIRIVIYLRRQDDALLSMYGEYMRRGFSGQRFEAFVENAMQNRAMVPYLFYRLMLGRWAEVFGRDAIAVRLFDRSQLAGGDILTDFMSVVLGEEDPDLTGFEPSPKDNVGLAAPVLEFLRVLHPVIPRRRDGVLNMERALLDDRIDALPAEPRPQLSAEMSRRIMAQFGPGNLWVRETFFPDRSGPLFPPGPDRAPQGNLGRVTLDEIASYLEALRAP